MALKYCKMGLSVIPVKGPYAKDYKDSKRPFAGTTWVEFQEKQPTESDIVHWFNKWPKANIALLTGPNTNLLDLDIDKGKGGFESLTGKTLPKSWIAGTPTGGLHYYFNWPDILKDIATTKQNIFPGVDVRGKGGYVVAPPSVGFNGGNYSWVDGCSLIDSPLSDPPKWLVDRLIETGLKPKSKGEFKPDEENSWLCDSWDGLPEGQGVRRKAFIKYLSYFFGKNCAPDFVYKLLEEWNQKNQPPIVDNKFDLDFRDVLGRFKSGQYCPQQVDKPEENQTDIEIKSPTQTADDFVKHLEWRINKPEVEMPFGFKALDDMTQGLMRQNLDTIGALTKGGKTLFLLNVLYNNVKAGHKVLYFPTEMTEPEILQRYLAISHEIPTKELQTGRLSEPNKEKLKEALEWYKQSEFHVALNHQPSFHDIMKAVDKVKPDILVIDYIQHVRINMNNKTKELEQFVIDLKATTKDLNISTLITAQPSKAKRDFKEHGAILKMTMHDFADSSIIEKESSRIFLIHPAEKKAGERYRNIEIEVTNRHGESGSVNLVFDSKKARFFD